MQKIAQFEKVDITQFSSQIKDRFKLNNDEINQVYDGIKLPIRSTTGSAGYDFYSPLAFSLSPKQSILIPTGIRAKIEEGWFLSLLPRSGLGCKNRFQLDNTIGIIDSDYYYSDNQGHIMLKITNDTNENKLLEIKQGMSFCQGIFIPYGITFDDAVSARRNGGFGSTSK